MSDGLKQRIESHVKRSLAAGENVVAHGTPSDAYWAIAQALHDLGITIATAAQTQRVDEKDLEDLGKDVSSIVQAAGDVKQNVLRAQRGEAPWGALKDSMVALDLAIEKVAKR